MGLDSISDFQSLSKTLAMGLGCVRSLTPEMVLPNNKAYDLKALSKIIHATYDRNAQFDQKERLALRQVINYTERLYKQADESLKQQPLIVRVFVQVLDWFRYNAKDWNSDKKVWDQIVKLYTYEQCEKSNSAPVVDGVFIKFKNRLLFEAESKDIRINSAIALKQIPDSLILHTLGFLDVKTVVTLRRVSKEWKSFANDCTRYHREIPMVPCESDCKRVQQVIEPHKLGYNIRNSISDVHHWSISGLEIPPAGAGYQPIFYINENLLFVSLPRGFEVVDIHTKKSLKRIETIPGNLFRPPLTQEYTLPIVTGFSGKKNTRQLLVTHRDGLSVWDLKTLECLYAFSNIPLQTKCFVEEDLTRFVTKLSDNQLRISTPNPSDDPIEIIEPLEDLTFDAAPFVEDDGLLALIGFIPQIGRKWDIGFNDCIYSSVKRISSYSTQTGENIFSISLPANSFLIGFNRINKNLLACQIKMAVQNGQILEKKDILQLRCTKTGNVLHEYPSYWMHQGQIIRAPFLQNDWLRAKSIQPVSNKDIMIVNASPTSNTLHTIDLKTGAILSSVTPPMMPDYPDSTTRQRYTLIRDRLFIEEETQWLDDNDNRLNVTRSFHIYDPLTGTQLASHSDLGDYRLDFRASNEQVAILTNYRSLLFVSLITGEIIGSHRLPRLRYHRGSTQLYRTAGVPWQDRKIVMNVKSIDGSKLEFELVNFS